MDTNAAKSTGKWYFNTATLIIGFLCVGPFMLPLVWFNPRFKIARKIIISVEIISVSYFLTIMLTSSLKSIQAYYQQLSQALK